MESSNLKLQNSDFSLVEETPNSQIPAYSHSLSVPSEPPDLRNWFASYQYQPPTLNSGSVLDSYLMHESGRDEKEESSGGFRIDGNKDETLAEKEQNPNEVLKCVNFSGNGHENQSLSKIRGSCESPTLISEPPDIRNWCSSYVYESPSLDTTDGLGDSTCKANDHEKDECLMQNRNKEEEKELRYSCINIRDGQEVVGEKLPSECLANCNRFGGDDEQEREPENEIQGHLESPLPLSEPTDIRHWFSSYVYESPSIETTGGFIDSVWNENESGKEGFLVKDSNSEKVANVEGSSKRKTGDKEDDDLQSKGLAKCISSWRDKQQVRHPLSEGRLGDGGNKNLPGRNDACLKYKSLENHIMVPALDGETSFLNKERSQCNLEHKFFTGTGLELSNNRRSSCSNDEQSPKYVTHREDFRLHESSKAEFQAENKQTHGSEDRKDDGHQMPENGFITTRKGNVTRKDGENLVQGLQHISTATSPIAGGRDAVRKRKALADATNFHHFPVVGITGKWKCPQRSKPDRGPALKQLGLEKWVRKL